MKNVKQSIRALLRSVGLDICRYSRGGMGVDPFCDMRRFLKRVEKPMIFDIGADAGQSVDKFKHFFPDSFIHSFESSPATYEKLGRHCDDIDDVKTWNCRVGSRPGTLPLLENSESVMSPFPPPGKLNGGRFEKRAHVEVVTLDAFASVHDIPFIHILKSDTQVYEVFKGAEGLMNDNRIGLVYFEFVFSNQYNGLPPFYDVFRFLLQHNFSLVTFYGSHFQADLVSWTDALLINTDYFHKLNTGAELAESVAAPAVISANWRDRRNGLSDTAASGRAARAG